MSCKLEEGGRWDTYINKSRSRNKRVSDGKVQNNGCKKIKIKISPGLKNTAYDWIFIMSGVKFSSTTYCSRCLPRILTFCWLLLCVTLTNYECGAISCYLGDWNSSMHINEQINSALHSIVCEVQCRSGAAWNEAERRWLPLTDEAKYIKKELQIMCGSFRGINI